MEPDSPETTEGFHLLDATPRLGALHPDIELTVADKLALARQLDGFGVGFIDGGRPGVSARDTEFFARCATEPVLRHARLVAHCSPRSADRGAGDDLLLKAVLDCGAPVVSVAVTADIRQIPLALRTTPDENVAALRETVAHLCAHGRRVFVACEHFFDGHRADPGYAREVAATAHTAGAEVVVLCDTNGGTLPAPTGAVVGDVRARTGARLGIRAHDDSGCAVACTLAAVEAGATHLECTANGYGERAGCADLFPVVAALELKLGRTVLPEGSLGRMTAVSRAVARTVRLPPADHQPYVGASVFARRVELHPPVAEASPELYRHIAPERVGNGGRTVVDEFAGPAALALKAHELGIDLGQDGTLPDRALLRVREEQARGRCFAFADASLELLLREVTAPEATEETRPFTVEAWRSLVDQRADGSVLSEVTVKVWAKGERTISTAEGSSAVDALDRALRTALERIHPALAARVTLVDWRAVTVRPSIGAEPAGALTRVLATFRADDIDWVTVGAAGDAVGASCQALAEGYAYGLMCLSAGR
ncbi:alpha-isopropylmalate synthase regulatory domain-containing protein [Streptomyces sp. NPDC049915]|uniref:alpha-isopropylmalate synthase regulatory domain-containing protein n=1 Tax=Streptomyces sp. NPDC049915 TaxID=3155510 RepID=UPI00344AE6DD